MKRRLNRLTATETNNPYSSAITFGGRTIINRKDALLVEKGGYSPDAIELYLDLLTDSSVVSSLSKQFDEITSRAIIIEPGGNTDDDKSCASFCEDVLAELQEPILLENQFGILPGDHSFDTLSKSLMVATITGISSAELVWARNNKGRAIIDRGIIVDPRRWKYEQDQSTGLIYPLLLTKTNNWNGINIPAKKFVFHRHWSIDGFDLLGSGLGATLYWLVLWKREALTFWLSLIDRHADPALIGTKPKSAKPEDVQDFIHALDSFARETNLVIPEGFTVSPITTSVSGSADLLRNLIDWCDSQINLILTGEDTVGQKGAGAFARESINNSIRIMRAQAWSIALNRTIRSTMLRWLRDYNYSKAKVPLIKRNFLGALEILEIALQYKELGFSVEPDTLEDATGVPIKKKPPKKPLPEIPDFN